MQKLIKNIPEKDRKKYLERLRSVSDIIESICEIVAEDRAASERITRSAARFKDASWSVETAFELGKQAYASTLIEMLNQATKEKPND